MSCACSGHITKLKQSIFATFNICGSSQNLAVCFVYLLKSSMIKSLCFVFRQLRPSFNRRKWMTQTVTREGMLRRAAIPDHIKKIKNAWKIDTGTSGAHSIVKELAFLTIIRIIWKSLPVRNTLAYFIVASVTKKNNYITLMIDQTTSLFSKSVL